jgi:hypothetical protein
VAAKIYQEGQSRISAALQLSDLVRDRPIFDGVAHAPGQPFACNFKIAMLAAGRVVRWTVGSIAASSALMTDGLW